jgi:hypothetical protein
VSKGNAEQHTAQAPQSHSSPNRVEVSADGQQGAPQSPGTPRPQSPSTPGTRDQPSGNGTQDRTPTGTAKSSPSSKPQVQEPTSPNGQSPQSPGTANRPQPTAGGRSGGAASPPPTQQKHQPGPPIQQKHEPASPTPQKQGPPQGSSQTTQPKQVPSLPAQPRPDPQPGGQAASASTPAQLRPPSQPTTGTPHQLQTPGPIPVWDPPPPPAPKQSVWGRLGFGRKAEPLEAHSTAPPVQQQPGTPITQPPRTSPSGATPSVAQTGPVAPTGPQTGAPVQQRPVPGNQPGSPAGPGAAVATGLSAAAATQVAPQVTPQAPPGQPSIPPGPVRPGETTGRTPAVPGGAPPLAAPAGLQAQMPPGLVNPAARMPGAPAYPAAPAAVPVPAPGQQTSDWPTGRNQPVPAGSEYIETEAYHAAKPKVGVARRTRKARLRLSRLDPWSVMKTSFLFSIAAGIMLLAAVYSVWTVLSTSQLFDSINEIVRSVVSTPGDTTPFRIEEYINTQKVMGVTALIACVDVVIFTALATLGSFLYNLAATMLGGLEITLAED